MSAAEESTENQGANDGDIGQESAEAIEADKEGDTGKVKDEENEGESEVTDLNNAPEKPNTAVEKSQNPAKEEQKGQGDNSSEKDEPAMSVVISEPDKDVTTQEANAQTEGRASPIGNAGDSIVSQGKEAAEVAESQSESESPLVAPPTSKAERAVGSETPAKPGAVAKDGFTANGKFSETLYTCT